ncbi:GntR family transcriptional regulator [Yoonia sediminilitoris]|uniref:GntR family transcriptional regulator n=1 Tax=Yoonia sediminilitoris TaxID=1286148 RepID=A0A2T6KQT3_9RHOB|nr:GntR family transcriptional regulator [Yoonia sediminilitoris]PUB18910.1 GntR family transcriptional regulator [Yoonia sediminilitoris]RCW99078.1 GntR family transcriptional regulator [Yoonia sediminilitoris]
MAKTSALPKYVQVSEMLIREIAAGHLADGARLPPEREMADELDVAVGTLRKALAEIESKGLLERVQGSGNYIRHKPVIDSVYAFFRLELLRGGGLPTARLLSVDCLPKPDDAPFFGDALQGHRIRRLRFLDDTSIAVEEIWLDGARAESVSTKDLSESLYHFYRHKLGLVISSVEDRIGVADLPDWTPDAFGLTAGRTVGFIERTGWDAMQEPVEYSRTWFAPDRARYVSRMGKG